MRCDALSGALSWWSCQSPVAHSCGLLNHLNSLRRGMFKLNTKFDAALLLYSLSHFECDSHIVHMLTQQHLPPPLTSTVKSSLFIDVHSSPLCLAARLYGCHANHSCYINNGWTSFWTDLVCKNSQQNITEVNSVTHFERPYTMIKWNLFLVCRFGSMSVGQLAWYTT